MRHVAVITGGSRGIGAATALALARRGWPLCLAYASSSEQALEVADACRSASGAPVLVVEVDVATAEGVGELFTAADEVGPLGILVNSAGVVGPQMRADAMSFTRVQHIFAVNAVGTLMCCAAAIRRMSTRHGGDGGVIVNVSSGAARHGAPGEYVDYAATKGAVDTMTIGLAREVAAEGVRVNAVRPGLIDTEIHAKGGDPERVERLRHAIPLGRSGRPEEVAAAIVWLTSTDASYVTGAILDVTGGR